MNRGLLVLLPALLVAGSPKAQMRPGFEPNDVIRQVRARHPTPRHPEPQNLGTDDGEFLLDTNPVYVPAQDVQWYPSVAFGGGIYLVAWHDYRWHWPHCIYCARVSPNGSVLDSVGIAIAPSLGEEIRTAVAFDGTDFLVVWENPGDSNMDLYGARVSVAGTVLDSGGFPISVSPESQLHPAVAYQGPNFLVVWDDWRDGVRATRVTPAGVVLDPDGIVITATTDGLAYPGVASDSTNFLVVWSQNHEGRVYGARMNPAGVVLDTGGIRISSYAEPQKNAVVAFGGTNFMVAWDGWPDGGEPTLRTARVSPDGVVLDTSATTVAASVEWYEPPAIAFGDTTFTLVWRNYDGVLFAQVSRAGVVLDTGGITNSPSGNETNNRIVSDGTSFLAVWVDRRSPEPYDIFGARVTEGGIVLDSAGFAISTAARSQTLPAVAAGNTNFLVVWREERDGKTGICGARVDAAGAVLDSAGFAVSFSSDTESYPAVAFDGTNYLVVWDQYADWATHDIFGARVSPDGVVLDTNAIAISTARWSQERPALAFNGSDYLVAWSDWRDFNMICGTRVSPAGVVLDPDGIVIASSFFSDPYRPAVGSDGTNFFVVWADTGIYGARVSPVGAVLDPGGFRISTPTFDSHDPSLDFDGADYLVAWADRRNGVDFDIYGARVSTAGVLIDTLEIPISTAAGYQYDPKVEFGGTNFLVVWGVEWSEHPVHLFGAYVSPGGSVFGSGAVDEVTRCRGAVIVRGCGGQMLLAYSGWAGTVGGKKYSSDRIWGKMNPQPGIAEAPGRVRPAGEPMSTIVRGVLRINPQLTAGGSRPEIGLLNAAGRQVMKLKPGDNDVSRLAAGVYFLSLETSYRRSSFKLVLTE
jgi:hypothetical protein